MGQRHKLGTGDGRNKVFNFTSDSGLTFGLLQGAAGMTKEALSHFPHLRILEETRKKSR